MLIEFSVANFKSIKEMQTLGLSASKLKPKYLSNNENLIEVGDELKLLKSKAIYGANACGKSNMFRAFQAFLHIVERIAKDDNALNKINPFKLDESMADEPSFFQIIFMYNDIQYRYGFEATRSKVISEWLFAKKDRETELFTRSEGEEPHFNSKSFPEGDIFKEIYSLNDELVDESGAYLLLSSIATILKGKLTSGILDYFKSNLVAVSGLDGHNNGANARDFIEKADNKNRILELLKQADFGIEGISMIDIGSDDNEFQLVLADRRIYNEKGEKQGVFPMALTFEESQGTQKMFELGPYIIEALDNGGVLFIDEFDSRFHPLLTRKIVELFNSDLNINNAQLVFITHDTNLLTPKLLRRDQISFVEKNKYGASKLFSLAEFKGVRNDSSFEKEYFEGKYGAVPFLGDLDLFMSHAKKD